jgi:hypothetical protein
MISTILVIKNYKNRQTHSYHGFVQGHQLPDKRTSMYASMITSCFCIHQSSHLDHHFFEYRSKALFAKSFTKEQSDAEKLARFAPALAFSPFPFII